MIPLTFYVFVLKSESYLIFENIVLMKMFTFGHYILVFKDKHFQTKHSNQKF